MADLEMLFHTVDELTTDERKRLLHYLKAKVKHAETQEQKTLKPRILGLHAHLGTAWMSDDFNDELPDEFWGSNY